MEFLEYELTSPLLCMGETLKGSMFRACDTETIRYSVITGALRAYFGIQDIHAAGYLIKRNDHNKPDYLVYSPQDHVTGASKVPITVQFLRDALGVVYVRKGPFSLPAEMEISMGALKSRGFGRCKLILKRVVEGRIQGQPRSLRTRIPLDLRGEFDIRKVVRPRYGYLFRPISATAGVYVLSLFEGSHVIGPDILVEEVRHG